MKNKKFKLKKASPKTYKQYLRKEKNGKIFVLSMQFLILVAFLGLWELLAQTGVIDSFIVSSPSRIVMATIELAKTGDLFKHIFVTLGETVLGFIISTLIGTVIAILLYQSKFLRRILEPYIVVLNSLPKIALGPMIIIWFGAGTTAIVVMCILISVVMTTISMLNAYLEVDKGKILLMETMQANRWQILYKLIIPATFGQFITVLKVNVGLSWVGTIMGEYLVSMAGLGYLIIYGGQVFKLDLVMASTAILCILAALMYLIVAFIEKRVKNRK